ncbi:hypothetical protein SPRG_07391 [Saprolegnia parasitica CBS 223.65]|uniref:Uncharacterized protein n=1 Tax=Saprolegnia parasitica (strain CBS 223.65) TaxID=695850 RepID=A0A067CLV4_SAPPC|nr:hypothetical protein SPRG_07391 [Saprolegnia parasitica CBS 223.65]KDO27792.1 hypothetical protein SPRG_07391 [Saprolegnia parasitica CBS 223.65]|eukprot:XP_012201567.1 hypothetical protein SPRG_07391 [Saprolegnia parasitica CBS 223.65]
MEHEANWALDGDGLVENLFYYLWCKDEFGGGPSLLIPDTIIYKFTQPAYWYFTSKSGKVKKKAKASLANVQIEKEFCRKLCGIDIVAYYIYMENDSPTIEYLNVDGLKDFLYNRAKVHNGVLQRFVVSKGASNSMIRAVWTPKMCLLERKTNVRKLHDTRYGIYERAVTFDGADAYSNPDPVRGSILPGDIQYLCEQVVDHVMEVSFHKYRISRMVLHLKTDADDRVWLLWSSSIRLSHGEHRPIDMTSDAQVPAFVHLSAMPDGKPSKKNAVIAKCTSCAKAIDQVHMLHASYKAVIEHFRQLLTHLRASKASVVLWPPDDAVIAAAGGVGFGILNEMDVETGPVTEADVTIPPVLLYLHPNLTVHDFLRFATDPVFLYKTAPVCENCYLVYADFSTSALEVNTVREHAPAILRPKRLVPPLKARFEVKSTKPPDDAWLPKPVKAKPALKMTVKTQYPFTDPPTLPMRIDHTMLSDMERSLPSDVKRDDLKKVPYMPDEWKLVPAMVPNPNVLAHSLVKKEDDFFTDLTASHLNSESFHRPLQHMVESASRLDALKTTPTLGGLKTTKRNPYAIVQKLVGRDDTSSTFEKKARAKAKSSYRRRFRASRPAKTSTRRRESTASFC